MDRNRFSAIAHRHHLFANPVSLAKWNRVISVADPKPGEHVLDVGAGNCEMLIRLAEAYGVAGTAIEVSPDQLAEARRRSAGRVGPETLTLIEEDARVALARLGAGAFDMALCVGATHALGGLTPALTALRQAVRPGGHLLIGEGYWKAKPCPEYLAALQAEESEMQSHWQNVAAGEALGLVPLWACTASEDDWDEYEWLYSSSVERYCAEHPEDPDRDVMLARIRSWRQTYLKWGRDTLGFALYLFQVS
jgi:SAM-dependent methyltransferase